MQRHPEDWPTCFPKDEVTLVRRCFSHGIEFEFEVHLRRDYLIRVGGFEVSLDLMTSDLVVATEFLEHRKFALDC